MRWPSLLLRIGTLAWAGRGALPCLAFVALPRNYR